MNQILGIIKTDDVCIGKKETDAVAEALSDWGMD